MLSYDELKVRAVIDENNLNEEVANQTVLFLEVSEHFVKAIIARDKAKEELANVDAMIAILLRKEAEEQKEKITEAKIAEKVLMSEEHNTAFNNYMEAKENADRFQLLKEAFSQRCSLLKTLSELYTTGYFSIT